jgi:hypothetical protein
LNQAALPVLTKAAILPPNAIVKSARAWKVGA